MKIYYSRILRYPLFTFTGVALILFFCAAAPAQNLYLLSSYKILPDTEEGLPEPDYAASPRNLGYLSFFYLSSFKAEAKKSAAMPAAPGPCGEWARMYDLLNEESRKTLQKEWVTDGVNDYKYDHQGYYVLGPELLSDCDLRVKIGLYIQKRLTSDRSSRADKNFARQYSPEIIKVLRHIWDSPAFSTDGVHEDKYGILSPEHGLRQEVVVPFLEKLLREREGLNWYLTCLLIERPSITLRPILLELLKDAEIKQDLPEQVYLLITLQQISPASALSAKLEKISHSGNVSIEDTVKLIRMINNFKSGRKVTVEDVFKLDIKVDEL
jgi:hypothetical protein